MKCRSSLSFLSLGSLAVALVSSSLGLLGCDDGGGRDHRHGGRHFDDNSIVFGIDETKGADGKITSSFGYEMIDVLGHGSISRGIVTDELSCWAENLDDRLGQPHVAGGVAVFRGALLPAEGVAVVANRTADLKLDGAVWTNPGDPLTFESKGFVMPDVAPQTITMPSQDLVLTSPVAAAEVPVTTAQDLTFTWTPSDPAAPHESVVVSLNAVPIATPNARGSELRCFFDRTAGMGHIPSRLVSTFYALLGGGQTGGDAGDAGVAPAIKGRFHVATHSQLTIFAKGDWTVYVVATAEQRDQPFSLSP